MSKQTIPQFEINISSIQVKFEFEKNCHKNRFAMKKQVYSKFDSSNANSKVKRTLGNSDRTRLRQEGDKIDTLFGYDRFTEVLEFLLSC
jgi:hypothetical protein